MSEIEKNENLENLSKAERRRRKRDLKRLAKEKEIRNKAIKKWGIVSSIVIILVGGLFLINSSRNKRYQNAPKIQITPMIYNFGTISASEGIVQNIFEVKNAGVSELKISGMETSCGCTTAVLKKDDLESPVFGMHNNPINWSLSLAPSETADLTVFFDPNFHKNSFGSMVRTVIISSDDPGNKEEKITLSVNVER